MANINGGYVSIDVTSSDLFNEIDKALLTGKPILIYGDDVPYYADEVTYDSVGNTFDIVKGNQVINVASDGTITKTGDKVPHLYEYNIILSYDNHDGNSQYVYFTLLSNKNLELTLDNIKTLIGDRRIMCTSIVSDITTDLTSSNTTIVVSLYVSGGNIIFMNAADESEPDFSNLAVNGRSSVTQIL